MNWKRRYGKHVYIYTARNKHLSREETKFLDAFDDAYI
jgi:hypothetical protein